MATPLGTNDLRAYRRHGKNCDQTKDTFEPTTKTEAKADTCSCPIWVRGYLAKETDATGKQKRVFCSTAATDWQTATTTRLEWEGAGRLPAASFVNVQAIDKSAVTIAFAAKEWLAARIDAAGGDPIVSSTHEQYSTFVNSRLLPWCKENGIVFLKALEDFKTCDNFFRSWRVLKGARLGEVLLQGTKVSQLTVFRTFMNYCMMSEWMNRSGAKKIKAARSGDTMRHGLELAEYEQLLAAPGTGTALDREKVVAVKFMRWCGLRISDAVIFDSSKIVPNVSGTGWNCKFIPVKTRKQKRFCVVPMPQDIKDLLESLPGTVDANGNKVFFTASLSGLKGMIVKMGKAAQKDKKFAHAFSPHCLRHTFAIQNLNEGVDIKIVSRWLGHKSVAVTEQYYSSPLLSTEKQAELAYENARAAMKGKPTPPPATNVVTMTRQHAA